MALLSSVPAVFLLLMLLSMTPVAPSSPLTSSNKTHNETQNAANKKVRGNVYFEETFSDGDLWMSRWTNSSTSPDLGIFSVSRGRRFYDSVEDTGLRTTQDMKRYAISTKFVPFSNDGRDLVFQFTVKTEQMTMCGGSYLKLLDCDFDRRTFGSETEYLIMFGPDRCGVSNRQLQLIFSYDERQFAVTERLTYPADRLTHLYTLIIHPNNTLKILIDNEIILEGDIDQECRIQPPRMIVDQYARKPATWDDREYIDDPDSIKPEGWQDEKYIVDPESMKQEDWDDYYDGPWEPRMIMNMRYQGPWIPKKIPNPNYAGQWVPPMIPNPFYTYDPELYLFPQICGIGLDLWQVEAGAIFDNILVTDDVEYARERGEKIWRPRMSKEKKLIEQEDRYIVEFEEQGGFDASEDRGDLEVFKRMIRMKAIEELIHDRDQDDEDYQFEHLSEDEMKEKLKHMSDDYESAIEWGIEYGDEGSENNDGNGFDAHQPGVYLGGSSDENEKSVKGVTAKVKGEL